MALPLKEGNLIQITYREMSGDYSMPSLEAAEDYFTLMYLLNGDRTIITQTMTYTAHKGSVFLIPPLMYHQTVPASSEEYVSILIKFSPKYIEPLIEKYGMQFLENIFDKPIKNFDEEYRNRVLRLFEDLVRENEGDSPYKDIVLKCDLIRLLFLILEYREEETDENIRQTLISKPILEAILFMEKNYNQPLKLEMVAEVSGYAVSYFSRLFQEQMGKTFSDYLCYIRLRHVEGLLLSTDKSITEIALETGFIYPGNMTSVFKNKIGMTPREYRRRNRTLKKI